MDVLTIVLIVLAAVAVWAVVELALTIRKARSSVSELTRQASETIDEVRPVVAKLDGVVDEMAPASKQVEPLLEKASTAVDLLSVDLVRVESILSDVTAVSGAAAGVTNAVAGAAESVGSGVSGIVGKITGKGRKADAHAKLAEGEPRGRHLAASPSEAADEPVSVPSEESVERVSGDEGYFTYPEATEAAGHADAIATDKTND